jgi:hypothetical protein
MHLVQSGVKARLRLRLSLMMLVLEGENFVWDTLSEDYEFVQSLKEEIAATSRTQLMEAKVVAFQKFMNKIRGQ